MELHVQSLLLKLFIVGSVCRLSTEVHLKVRNYSTSTNVEQNGLSQGGPAGPRPWEVRPKPVVNVVVITQSPLPGQLRRRKDFKAGISSSKQTTPSPLEDFLTQKKDLSQKAAAPMIETPGRLFFFYNSSSNTSHVPFDDNSQPSTAVVKKTNVQNTFTPRVSNEGARNLTVKHPYNAVTTKGSNFSDEVARKISDLGSTVKSSTVLKNFDSTTFTPFLRMFLTKSRMGDDGSDQSSNFLDQHSKDNITNVVSTTAKSVDVISDKSPERAEGDNRRIFLKNEVAAVAEENYSKRVKNRKGQRAAGQPSVYVAKASELGEEKLGQGKPSAKSRRRSGEGAESNSRLSSDVTPPGKEAPTQDLVTIENEVPPLPLDTTLLPHDDLSGQQEENHFASSLQQMILMDYQAPKSRKTSLHSPVCPPGKFGSGCLKTCGRCEGGVDNCDQQSGLCHAGCEFGWMGPHCLTPCMLGTWGDRCYGCGRCAGGDSQCNRTTGHCLKGCETGWYGLRCKDECGHCLDGPGACHPLTGTCLGGCKPGWQGSSCHALCLHKTWGPNCSKVCGQCLEDICNSTDGHCAKGCNAGWRDMFCTTPCNGNSYGPNCSLTCGKCLRVKAKIKVRDVFNTNNHNGDACNRETGACLYGCQPGYTGINCESPCEPGWFGLNCSQRCPQCPEGQSCTCDPVTGQCTGMSCKAPQGCGYTYVVAGAVMAGLLLPGIIGVGAAIFLVRKKQRGGHTCAGGRFGPRCEDECGHCRQGMEACHPVTGGCLGGCQPGWQGATCHEPCPHQHWGENCSQTCGHCLEDFCNGSDGRCIKGCAAGWRGVRCEVICSDTYDRNCAVPCGKCKKVSNGSLCHPETGECAHGCEAGYVGKRCQETCELGTYGQDCAQVCPLCQDGHVCACSATDGRCPSNGCLSAQASAMTMGTGSVIASSSIAAILALTVIAMATWVYVLRRNLKSQQHIEPITASTRTSTAESEPPQDGAP